ncbi:hypothetical protein HYT25_01045 [Candidatus Pacearchaeota archaeon]|nr:hypothetical protein [Candidatus Pacearchaeota archaeon]
MKKSVIILLVLIFSVIPLVYAEEIKEKSFFEKIKEFFGNLFLERGIIKSSDKYEYEFCNTEGVCNMIAVTEVIQPSAQTSNMCNPEGLCEDVPVNRLLLKEGTDKKRCSNAPYLSSDYVDNWWNANGLIDECEMPPTSDMQFAFKQHNQTILSHTGTLQISLTILNYENNYLALQILTAEDHNNDNLPDEWTHCGNVDTIKGKTIKIIRCTGTKLKFVKLVNPEWNPSSLFLDRIEVLKIE